jgi:hypothetical protein
VRIHPIPWIRDRSREQTMDMHMHVWRLSTKGEEAERAVEE